MQTKALGPRWPRAHDVVDMLATAGAVVTEQARPVRDLDLINAGSRACQVERVRLEFPILSLNPGLRQRCVAPDVWPTLSRA